MSAVTIERLAKRYGAVPVLEEVTVEVPAGSRFGLLGLNGAGKTTTLHCALGLVRPSRGRCEVLGVPSTAIHRTSGRVGVLFEGPSVYAHLTVRQNLDAARVVANIRGGRTPADVERLLGLERLSTRKAKRLSFGTQRRIAIARALLGEPRLVVLDEPLSGLDVEGVAAVLSLVRELNVREGITFVLSSHRLHEMETLVDRMALIHGGRVVASGSVDELLGQERQRLVLEVDRPEEATAGLLEHGLADAAEPATNGAIVVAVRSDPADVNRWLVQRGFGVRQLTPMRPSLVEFFRRMTAGPKVP
jgi:ABC-2 type transport system ATP-binding protein